LSAVFDWLIKTHISLRLRDGSSLGALWELSGSSMGALWELVAVAGIDICDYLGGHMYPAARLAFCPNTYKPPFQ
jgi:hypothetical protein